VAIGRSISIESGFAGPASKEHFIANPYADGGEPFEIKRGRLAIDLAAQFAESADLAKRFGRIRRA
jgi:hypothetical protein